MVRSLLLAAAMVGLLASATDAGGLDGTDERRHIFQMYTGIGYSHPTFDTDDNLKGGAAFDLRLSYRVTQRSRFGFMADFYFDYLAGEKRTVDIDLPHLQANGDETCYRRFYYAHLGAEWTMGTPFLNRFRPRIGAGVGPCILRTERMFEVTDMGDAGRLELDSNTDVGFSAGVSAGFQYDFWNRRGGLGLETYVLNAWGMDTNLPSGQGDENTLTVGVLATFYWLDLSRLGRR